LLSSAMNRKTKFRANKKDEMSERLAEMILHHFIQSFSLPAFILSSGEPCWHSVERVLTSEGKSGCFIVGLAYPTAMIVPNRKRKSARRSSNE
jgi:hypothetical protein